MVQDGIKEFKELSPFFFRELPTELKDLEFTGLFETLSLPSHLTVNWKKPEFILEEWIYVAGS